MTDRTPLRRRADIVIGLATAHLFLQVVVWILAAGAIGATSPLGATRRSVRLADNAFHVAMGLVVCFAATFVALLVWERRARRTLKDRGAELHAPPIIARVLIFIPPVGLG